MKTSRIYPDTPDECIDHYISSAVNGENISYKTREGYIFGAKYMSRILEQANMECLPYLVSKKEIEYLQHTFSPLAIRTQKYYFTMMNRYLSFYGNRILDDEEMHWPRDQRVNVDWLQPEQARELLDFPMTLEQECAIKMELCLGMRRIEVIRLRVRDVHPTHLDVRGKGHNGGKWRSIPYPDGEMYQLFERLIKKRENMLREYQKHHKSFKEPEELFLQIRGCPMPYSEKGTGFDAAVIEPLREKIGFHFSNHTLRRTMARQLYIYNDVPLIEISKILGHDDTKTTVDYIGVNLDDMSNSMRKLRF